MGPVADLGPPRLHPCEWEDVLDELIGDSRNAAGGQKPSKKGAQRLLRENLGSVADGVNFGRRRRLS
jgi:hypothetical protein